MSNFNPLENENNIPPDISRRDNLPNQRTQVGKGESEAFNLAGFLEALAYPASKEDILDFAVDQQAQPEILDMLDQLPDTIYNNPSDISQALEENANMVM
ncbi:MAG: DUF2795 domain-containing protein [Patescibacteria group bacterium]|nr:DUF2795 domain-containing protein [Patescibacteria group bacterium]